jgi:hypothetical protein
MQQNNHNIENLMDTQYKRSLDSINILEKKMNNALEEKMLDLKRIASDLDKRSAEQQKSEFESLLKQIGQQMQDGVSRLKQEVAGSAL